jgi:predicted esterase
MGECVQERIILAGFSMGGAGAWHIAAHYPSPWCGVHTGAGFVETIRYNSKQGSSLMAGKTFETPEDCLATMPPCEQTLLQVYDVPDYTRNLLHTPLIVYSGQEDAQMQAALVMQEAFERNGAPMPHLIGEGMGHAYHPTVAEAVGRCPPPHNVFFMRHVLINIPM